MIDFFRFLKGIVDLQRAFHYQSIFIYHQAKLSLGVLVNNTDDPLFSFYIYFSLGICEYYLNNIQDAYSHLKRALIKINLLPNPSNEHQRSKQKCLAYCGYLCLELKNPLEAEIEFNKAYNIQIMSTVYSGTTLVSPYEGTVTPIPQTIREREDNIETNLGLAICSQIRASSSRVLHEQKSNYKTAYDLLKKCLISINPEIRSIVETKCIEIENELKKFEKPVSNPIPPSVIASQASLFSEQRGNKRDQSQTNCDSPPVPIVQRTEDISSPKSPNNK